jgi:hypothetical protein
MTEPGEATPGEQRRRRRAAEAHDRAEQAGRRAEEARDRLAELRRQSSSASSGGKPEGSTPEDAFRAEQLAAVSRRRALQAAERAVAAIIASAEVHESAAAMHNHMADLGRGDPQKHRELARGHREAAAADRAEAQIDERLRERLSTEHPSAGTSGRPAADPTGSERNVDSTE